MNHSEATPQPTNNAIVKTTIKPTRNHAKFGAIASQTTTIAIVDDDPEMHTFLKELYTLEGFNVCAFEDGLSALKAAEIMRNSKSQNRWNLVICDLKLPDIDGLEFIERLKESGVDVPTILITAHATVETAAAALQRGVFDYIAKPINPVELSVISKRAISLRNLEKEYADLRKRADMNAMHGNLIGKSSKMRQVFDLIDRVAGSLATVLITGESGSGKEMVASAIHAQSPRAQAPFIAINCSAIPDHLLESELFGHKRGAFTGANENRKGLFEEANGGTIFLDEIGDMPLALQAKLLRVLQERKIKPVGSNELRDVDVRIIAATHKDLQKAIAEGHFREDLYFRLCVVPIRIPPLRERTEDIPVLVEHFLTKFCELNGVPLKRLTKVAMSKLMCLNWSGNVRELENTIERAVVLSDRDLIDENEIRVEGVMDRNEKVRDLFAKLPTLDQLERWYISYVMEETGEHKERAAEILGINRKTLYRKERASKGEQEAESTTGA